MRYLGGKFRLKKDIKQLISQYRKPNQAFVSPFCGSCWIESELENERLLYDKHYYLIEMWKAILNGWEPPQNINEEEYQHIKTHLDENPALSGFVGFVSSYGGKWFGGYARGESRNFTKEGYGSVLRKAKKLKGATFNCADFTTLQPQDAIIYCDPPYFGTTQYATNLLGKFDHSIFWDKAREWSKNNIVLVSEYQAPDDFICIWEKAGKTDLKDSEHKPKNKIEKVFLKKPE